MKKRKKRKKKKPKKKRKKGLKIKEKKSARAWGLNNPRNEPKKTFFPGVKSRTNPGKFSPILNPLWGKISPFPNFWEKNAPKDGLNSPTLL